MKKRLIIPLLMAALALGVTVRASACEVSARAAIVYEPVTGTVLFEKDADERLLVASTTKIMTAMVVLENCGLDEKVLVKPEHAAVEGSSMYLKPGGEYTVEDLLYGLLLASGNDAAAALADHTAGSMEAFAGLMNARCETLGLTNTHFVNAHGLDAEGHYSSARDLALITAAAMENETFCRIFSTRSYTVQGLTYTNHNKLLTDCEGCTGGKTGYTEAAGRILVSCAEREGMTLICVTISDPKDWEDHKQLYDQCFGTYCFIPLPQGDDCRVPVISGSSEYVSVVSREKGLLTDKTGPVELKYFLPDFVFSPVVRGETAGRVEVCVGGALDLSTELYYADTVYVDRSMLLSPWERFKRAWALSCEYGMVFPGY